MQDNFNIHSWKLKRAITELEEKTCPECGCKMESTMCNECGYMEEGATFTDKFDDNPKLKGGQKDLPDEVQAKIVKEEGEDHEVSMAQNSLQSIISSASQLMSKLGDDERNIPGWIQDHIAKSENYIEQANQSFHELESPDEDMDTDVVSEVTSPKVQEAFDKITDALSRIAKKMSDDEAYELHEKLKGWFSKTYEEKQVNEAMFTSANSNNPEGDKLVLRFLQGIAKKFDYPVYQAALFVKDRIKKLGY